MNAIFSTANAMSDLPAVQCWVRETGRGRFRGVSVSVRPGTVAAIGSDMNDDGYQGVQSSEPLTAREMEIAGLLDAIQRAEEAAQDAEDCERYDRASKHRARARGFKAQLAALTT